MLINQEQDAGEVVEMTLYFTKNTVVLTELTILQDILL